MTLRIRPLAAVLALAVLVAPAIAGAQQASPAPAAAPAACPGGGGGGMGPMHGIQLTPAQRQQIKGFRTAFRTQYPCGTKPPESARQQLRSQIMGVLTPAQQQQYQANEAAEHPGAGAPAPSASP